MAEQVANFSTAGMSFTQAAEWENAPGFFEGDAASVTSVGEDAASSSSEDLLAPAAAAKPSEAHTRKQSKSPIRSKVKAA